MTAPPRTESGTRCAGGRRTRRPSASPRLGGSRGGGGAWAAGNNDQGDIVGSISQGRLTRDKRDYGGVDAREHCRHLDAMAWTRAAKSWRRPGPGRTRSTSTTTGRPWATPTSTPWRPGWPRTGRSTTAGMHPMGEPVPGMSKAGALGGSEGGWATGSIEMPGESEEFPCCTRSSGSGPVTCGCSPRSRASWDTPTAIAHGVDDARDEVDGPVWVGPVRRMWGCASQLGSAGASIEDRSLPRRGPRRGLARRRPRHRAWSASAARETIVVTTTIQAAVDLADPATPWWCPTVPTGRPWPSPRPA